MALGSHASHFLQSRPAFQSCLLGQHWCLSRQRRMHICQWRCWSAAFCDWTGLARLALIPTTLSRSWTKRSSFGVHLRSCHQSGAQTCSWPSKWRSIPGTSRKAVTVAASWSLRLCLVYLYATRLSLAFRKRRLVTSQRTWLCIQAWNRIACRCGCWFIWNSPFWCSHRRQCCWI